MAKAKGRAALFEDVDGQNVEDYDPEGQRQGEEERGSDSESSEDASAAVEHYVSVGKSKLRSNGVASLGPQYRGSKVSRQALDLESAEQEEDEEDGSNGSDYESGESGEDDYDNPDQVDVAMDTEHAADSDIDSDDALADSDTEKLKEFIFRGSQKPRTRVEKAGRAKASDYMSESEEDSDEHTDDRLDELVNGGTGRSSGEDDDGDSEEEDGNEENARFGETSDEEDGPISKAPRPALGPSSSNPDVEKGKAIQQQRKAYDALLNIRIRLQKALIAANTFPTVELESPEGSEPYEAAEEAAVKLLNTISSMRDNMNMTAHTGEKRKRQVSVSMPSDNIWLQLQEEDQRATKFRDDRLEKWSRKVQSVNVQAPKGLASRNRTLISSLHEQLDNPDSRLIKRSRVPRSCAPAQAALKAYSPSDGDIYDDADFYQLLLKELVDQRTVDSISSSTTALPSVMLTAAKEAKARKNVDRKASKGRKMRFTVHEKLQNFMAPEDRRSWEQSAIDRFFVTLFGRRMELDEADSEDSEVDMDEEGFPLFRQ